MHSSPPSPAEHHYEQAERALATLGSLAATPEEATREAAAERDLLAIPADTAAPETPRRLGFSGASRVHADVTVGPPVSGSIAKNRAAPDSLGHATDARKTV